MTPPVAIESDLSVQVQSDSESRPSKTAPSIEIVEEAPHQGPTPEEALASSRKAIEAADAKARSAQQREAEAQQELVRLRASQQTDQVAVLASAIEASSAERDRFADSWQMAMESGDFKAAALIQKDLMMATAKLERANGELAVLKAGASQRQQPNQQQAIPNKSQEWINSHGEFYRHKNALLVKHQELVDDGVVPESARYFRELDAEYARLTDNADTGSHSAMSNDRRPQKPQFDGASPSRGGSGTANSHTVQTMLGPVGVRQVNGEMLITIPSHIRELFNEGAKDCGMSVEAYAKDQIEIARERNAGGSGGLITSEGNIYK